MNARQNFAALLCARLGHIGEELSQASEPRAKKLSQYILDCIEGLEPIARSLAETTDTSLMDSTQRPPRPERLH